MPVPAGAQVPGLPQLQDLRAHQVLADKGDTLAVPGTVDNPAADKDKALVDALVDAVAGMVVEVAVEHTVRRLLVAPEEVAHRQPGFDAMCCRNWSTGRIFLSDPVDRETHCIALRRLGRK